MKQVLFIVLFAMLWGSCAKSRLDLQNPNQITTGTFWETESDVTSALAATYNLFRNSNYGGMWMVRGVEMSNGRGDDFFIRNDVSDLYSLSTFTNAQDNGVVNTFWNTCYKAIFSANQIIAETPTISAIEATEQKQLVAEAKFLRGLNYFFLVTNFGDVPLRLTLPQSQADYYLAKSPEEDVWKQIIADFTDAAADLPASYSDEWVGRATQGAAIAYLGKSYLYHKDYALAEAQFAKIMTGQYHLMSDFSYNFDLAHENNAESVFEIQLADVGGTNPWTTGAGEALGVTTAQEFAPSQIAGWFEFYPTDKLFNEFKKEKTTDAKYDPRLIATLVWDGEEGETALGGESTFYQQSVGNFFPTEFGFQARIKKYQNYTQESEVTGTNGGSYTSSINERALRYADVLLMHAEAVTMLSRPQDAYADVDSIRTRAHLPLLATGYGTDEMMSEIRHQRMIEFAREGYRFYDLKRWGLLATELSNSDKIGKQYYVAGKFDYFPIPQAEIDANPKMEQNSLWK